MTQFLRHFAGRQDELSRLRALTNRSTPSLGLVYGRRGVGKTHLVGQLGAEERRFYHQAAETTPAMNRLELMARLAEGEAQDGDPGWPALVRQLAELGGGEPPIVVLDEAQHLFADDPEGFAALVGEWSRLPPGSDLTLVLSATGTAIDDILGGERPEGEDPFDETIRMDPFDYRDAGRLVSERPPAQKAYISGVFGGLPAHLSDIDRNESFGEAVARTILSPHGPVHTRVASMLARMPDIRRPGTYHAVLAAVAAGARQTKEVARAAGLANRPTVARRTLESLERRGLLRRRRNLGAGGRAPWKSRIIDPALRFWSRFTHRFRHRLATGKALPIWREAVTPQLDAFMAVAFEQIAEQAFERFHDTWGFPAADQWTRWRGEDRNQRTIDIDIAARLSDGRVLTGQIVWSSEPIDVDHHFHLERDLEALAGLGEEWAGAALDPDRSAGHLYVSAGGFTDHFRDRARDAARMRLVDLSDLYPEADQ